MDKDQDKPEKPEKERPEKGDEKGKKKKKLLFEKELVDIMYAFGDSKTPNPATLELLEEYIMDYMEVVLSKAYQRAIRRDPTSTKLLKDDLLYFLKEDSKVISRVTYMLKIEKEFLRDKKKIFNDLQQG